MEYIDILEVLETCSDLLCNPEDEEKNQKFQELKNKIIVKPYLALKEKELVFEKTIKDIQMLDDTLFTFTSMVEISLTFNALLAYTNIDGDVIDLAKDYDFYDLLWATGFCDYILEFCKEDYKRVTDMVYHMLSYENLFELISELRGIDAKSIEDLTSEFKRFRLETKPDTLIALGNIAAKDDSLLTQIKQNITDQAYNIAKQKEENSEKS